MLIFGMMMYYMTHHEKTKISLPFSLKTCTNNDKQQYTSMAVRLYKYIKEEK
jgi:hypothetical protein